MNKLELRRLLEQDQRLGQATFGDLDVEITIVVEPEESIPTPRVTLVSLPTTRPVAPSRSRAMAATPYVLILTLLFIVGEIVARS